MASVWNLGGASSFTDLNKTLCSSINRLKCLNLEKCKGSIRDAIHIKEAEIASLEANDVIFNYEFVAKG